MSSFEALRTAQAHHPQVSPPSSPGLAVSISSPESSLGSSFAAGSALKPKSPKGAGKRERNLVLPQDLHRRAISSFAPLHPTSITLKNKVTKEQLLELFPYLRLSSVTLENATFGPDVIALLCAYRKINKAVFEFDESSPTCTDLEELAATFSSLDVSSGDSSHDAVPKERTERKREVQPQHDTPPLGETFSPQRIAGLDESTSSGSDAPCFLKLIAVAPLSVKKILGERAAGKDAVITIEEITRFYNELEEGLRKDEAPASFSQNGIRIRTTIAKMIQNFERSHAILISMWKSGRGWQGDIASPDLKEERNKLYAELLQIARIEAIQMVANISNIITQRAGIPSCEFEDVGSFSIFSDVDYSAVCETTKFRTNSIQGIKIALANAIWRALFKKNAGILADCNFYCPQIGKYLTHEIRNPQAKALFSYASFMGSLLQMVQQAPREKVVLYVNMLRANLTARQRNPILPEERERCTLALKSLNDCIADIEKFEAIIQAMKKAIPAGESEDIVADFFLGEFSLILSEIGSQIDRELNDDKRDFLIAQFYFYTILRERFLPEGYYTTAFNVVCKDRGSQAHQRYHLRLAERQAERSQELEEQLFKVSTVQGLRDAAAEITAFFSHKKDIVEASKSGERAAKSACELIHRMLGHNDQLVAKLKADQQQNLQNAELQRSLTLSLQALEKQRRLLKDMETSANMQVFRMGVFLATKKQTWDEGSFIRAFRINAIDAESRRYENTLVQLNNHRVKTEILNKKDIKDIPFAFFTKFQELFGLEDRVRFFSLQTILQRKDSNLVKFLIANSPNTAPGSKKVALKSAQKEELWSLLCQELRTESGHKLRVNLQAIDALAFRIFRQVTPTTDEYQPLIDKRFHAQELAAALRTIFCHNLDESDSEKELFRLAESVHKSGRIVRGMPPISQEVYAKKELAKMKSELRIVDAPDANKQLLGVIQSEYMTSQAMIDCYCFATSFIETPQKPDAMPSFSVALVDPDSIRKYFGSLQVAPMQGIGALPVVSSAIQLQDSASSPSPSLDSGSPMPTIPTVRFAEESPSQPNRQIVVKIEPAAGSKISQASQKVFIDALPAVNPGSPSLDSLASAVSPAPRSPTNRKVRFADDDAETGKPKVEIIKPNAAPAISPIAAKVSPKRQTAQASAPISDGAAEPTPPVVRIVAQAEAVALSSPVGNFVRQSPEALGASVERQLSDFWSSVHADEQSSVASRPAPLHKRAKSVMGADAESTTIFAGSSAKYVKGPRRDHAQASISAAPLVSASLPGSMQVSTPKTPPKAKPERQFTFDEGSIRSRVPSMPAASATSSHAADIIKPLARVNPIVSPPSFLNIRPPSVSGLDRRSLAMSVSQSSKRAGFQDEPLTPREQSDSRSSDRDDAPARISASASKSLISGPSLNLSPNPTRGSVPHSGPGPGPVASRQRRDSLRAVPLDKAIPGAKPSGAVRKASLFVMNPRIGELIERQRAQAGFPPTPKLPISGPNPNHGQVAGPVLAASAVSRPRVSSVPSAAVPLQSDRAISGAKPRGSITAVPLFTKNPRTSQLIEQQRAQVGYPPTPKVPISGPNPNHGQVAGPVLAASAASRPRVSSVPSAAVPLQSDRAIPRDKPRGSITAVPLFTKNPRTSQIIEQQREQVEYPPALTQSRSQSIHTSASAPISSFQFSGVRVTSESLQTLFRKSPQVEQLSFVNCKLDEGAFRELLKFSNLVHLNFSGVVGMESLLPVMKTAIMNFSRLESLDLSRSDTNDNCLLLFLFNRNLKRVNLSHVKSITPVGFSVGIITSIGKKDIYPEFILSGCHLSLAEQLPELRKRLPHIRFIN
jgi:hypothetical protein